VCFYQQRQYQTKYLPFLISTVFGQTKSQSRFKTDKYFSNDRTGNTGLVATAVTIVKHKFNEPFVL
jgi:hypothetical protein